MKALETLASKGASLSAFKNFRTYRLAVQFHHACQGLSLPGYLRDQLVRATSSVVLNLGEGSAKPTAKDQARFYYVALGSLREAQAALDLAPRCPGGLPELADHLGASLYKLCRHASGR